MTAFVGRLIDGVLMGEGRGERMLLLHKTPRA